MQFANKSVSFVGWHGILLCFAAFRGWVARHGDVVDLNSQLVLHMIPTTFGCLTHVQVKLDSSNLVSGLFAIFLAPSQRPNWIFNKLKTAVAVVAKLYEEEEGRNTWLRRELSGRGSRTRLCCNACNRCRRQRMQQKNNDKMPLAADFGRALGRCCRSEDTRSDEEKQQ